MRLRKIGLGNPHKDANGYGGLFFPEAQPLYLPNALGLYLDKVTPEQIIAVRRHFAEVYRSQDSTISNLRAGDAYIDLFADYSFRVCDNEGKEARDHNVQNRNALLVGVPNAFSEFPLFFRVTIGEYGGRIMESPEIRGGVPRFEGINAYIEIANGKERGTWSHHDPALSILESVVTEFETPRHEIIFREILSGTRKEQIISALIEHLHVTGQAEKWRQYE